jgi:hypothetical protein
MKKLVLENSLPYRLNRIASAGQFFEHRIYLCYLRLSVTQCYHRLR